MGNLFQTVSYTKTKKTGVKFDVIKKAVSKPSSSKVLSQKKKS